MKFSNAILLPNVTSSLLTTSSTGQVIAAALTDVTGLVPFESENTGGRLTLTSGGAVTMTDVTGSTLYYTPYNGDTIPLWNTSTSEWDLVSFTEKSLSLSSLTASKVYDVWATYANNGTFTLTTTAWTNYTTRATGLTLQNGVLVKSGSPGSCFLGSICIDASKIGYDTMSQRWVWNNSNRVPRKFFSADTNAAGYTLVGGSGVVQYCRNVASTSQSSVLIGRVAEAMQVTACNYAYIPAGASMCPAINISTYGASGTGNNADYGYSAGNSTATLQSGAMMSNNYQPVSAALYLFTQCEFAIAGTITFYPGASSANNFRSGMSGIFWG